MRLRKLVAHRRVVVSRVQPHVPGLLSQPLFNILEYLCYRFYVCLLYTSQQLDQAMESREERLARLALQDQKDALRAEIDQIEKKADSQLEALDREQEAIEAAYEERMKDAALQAEAEKLILTQSQDELLSLISSYAPEYDALGQTLGCLLYTSMPLPTLIITVDKGELVVRTTEHTDKYLMDDV